MVKSPTQTCPQAPIRSGRCHGGHGFPTDSGSSYRDWTPSQDGTRVAAQRLRQPSSSQQNRPTDCGKLATDGRNYTLARTRPDSRKSGHETHGVRG